MIPDLPVNMLAVNIELVIGSGELQRTYKSAITMQTNKLEEVNYILDQAWRVTRDQHDLDYQREAADEDYTGS